MNIEYKVPYKGGYEIIKIDEPNTCPICKHSLKPTILHREIMEQKQNEKCLVVTYWCTNCFKPFICFFSNLSQFAVGTHFNSKLAFIEPNCFENKEFDECINKLSSDFVKIYNQANNAENLRLDQIAGIGYRKALEFLIKDFLIKHEHIESEKVVPTPLGTCINTMIDNPQLRTVSSRATWLGNDQTHYEQKYQDKDIQDLKRLIELSVHWITMICLTDEAESIEKK
jgi:hypothetical protein